MNDSLINKKDKWFSYSFWIVSAIAFVVIAIRSATVPFHHDEVATFYFYIQTGDYLPFMAHVDANNHVLNSTLSFICFKLFGDSPFSLRLPNTLSFLLLVAGTWRIQKELKSPLAKVLLIGGMLLTFHFHTFFSTCRGYGLSMALLVLATSYFLSYLKNISFTNFVFFVLSFQLAISANLILIMVILPLLLVIAISQIINKQLKWKVVTIHLLNLGLLLYWIKFSFFLQDSNALYYGEGTSYYKTTYLSLTRLLSGYTESWIALTGTVVLISSLIATAFICVKEKFTLKSLLQNNTVVLFFILSSLIIGFYTLKKLMGVNYPEDRTGLFFYVFYVLAIVALCDYLPDMINNKLFGMIIILAFGTHYAMALNFRKHSLTNYETIPQSFYDYLVQEQKQRKERITIAGHRVRELFYAFYNYRNDGYLNLMDDSDFLHMNADYALALKNEKGYYQLFYDEVMTEPDWDFVLLKRKYPIMRKLVMNIPLNIKAQGTNEFYDIWMLRRDTIIESQKPIMAEFDFKVINKDIPNRAWISLQLDTSESAHYYYKHMTLSALHYKWDENKIYTYSLCTGPIRKKLSYFGTYIYNPNLQNIDIEIKALRFYELHGKGVDVVSKVVN